jgi:VanZ family protein
MPSSVAPATARAISARDGFRHWASAWVPVILCIGIIAIESTPRFGADHTTGPLQHFFEFLFHKHFTQPEWWRLHMVIRKGGHFVGYGLQSAAWFRAFWMTWRAHDPTRMPVAVHGLAMLGTFFIAGSDEFHQTFLPNRTGSFVDVMTDCSGALLLQILIWLWMVFRKRGAIQS